MTYDRSQANLFPLPVLSFTEKLSNIVRSVTSDAATARSGLTTPTPWDQPSSRGRLPSDAGSHATSTQQPYTPSYNPSAYNPRDSRDPYNRRESRDTSAHRERIERLGVATRPLAPSPSQQPQHFQHHHHQQHQQQQQHHGRSDSIGESAADYPEPPTHSTNGRRHDYDVQAMESDLSPRSQPTKNPIPAPTVSIRSEFPTMNRSRQQQSLACLITVEVPEGNWSPDAEDLRQSSGGTAVPQDEPYGIMRFPTVRTSHSSHFEPQENLDEVAEDLRNRVDNWHGLEFNRYVPLLPILSPLLFNVFHSGLGLKKKKNMLTISS